MLEAHDISRSFDGIAAVQDVSLAVGAGDLAGLIGPNGAGKSTLVNLLAGSLALSSGRVTVGGRDVSRWSPERIARAGVVRTHQRCRIFAEMTVEANVRVAVLQQRPTSTTGRLARGPRARHTGRQRAVNEILDRFELGAVRHRLAGELAFGMQRRLELARSVATNPRFLLLDEPFSGMEEHEIADMSTIVRSLAEGSIGILLIEHHTDALFALCSRVTVMNTGRVIAKGSAAEVQTMDVVRKAYLGEDHSVSTREVTAS